MNKAWVGVDAGKEFHWAHVLDVSAMELLSRKVENDEADIGRLIDEALSLAEGLVWAVDPPGGSAALLLALLWERNQRVFSHYQTSAQLRRAGHKRVVAYLRNRSVKGSNKVADKALAAANSQSVSLPAKEVASRIVAELAKDVLGLKERIERIDEEIGQRFFARPEARILTSLPGMGPILGAEFLVAVDDIRTFESADRLAAYAGLVPAARDSGKRVGNNKRMSGGNKILKRVFYQSAFVSLRSGPHSRAFYDRKRAEGKTHTQAPIALARRRVNVVWAMLRDRSEFEERSAA